MRLPWPSGRREPGCGLAGSDGSRSRPLAHHGRGPVIHGHRTGHEGQRAQRFYEKRRATGYKHQQALRALAHKWVKILLAMQRTGSHYNEAIYQQDRKLSLDVIP